jgi:transcription initiation factor TFIIF subunit alpha
MSTKDFLMRFRKRIKRNERNRDVITSLLKRVARQTVASDSGVKMLELKPELA